MVIQFSKISKWLFLAAYIPLISVAVCAESPTAVELRNHQPFPVRMPLTVRGASTRSAPVSLDGRPAQISGKDLVILADLPASSTRQLKLEQGRTDPAPGRLALTPVPSGISLSFEKENAGQLAWDLILQPAPGRSRATKSPLPDRGATFSPLPLSFRQTATGPLFDTWSAEATTAGLTLRLDLDSYSAGFLDVRASLTNAGAKKTRGVYCAVVCRWTQSEVAARSLCYDNRRADFTGTTTTSYRTSDAGHHVALARGVDWINTRLANGTTAVWLYDFSESFATLKKLKDKKRWMIANQPQLGREAQSAESVLYGVTEITRPSVERYADRIAGSILPPRGETLHFKSRMGFQKDPLSDEQADQMFVGYTCYREQETANGTTVLSIGVPHVKFGTSYFPYSTLGENFDFLKLPGQDREGYWPLSGDVVNQWPLFADDIRRDLRIAKAMGFDVLRLHHLEVLYGVTPEKRREFLDFFFAEIREVGLKALLDVRMRPGEVADLVARYREVVDGVEIENEVLIWGIDEGRQEYWNSVYDAVKRVAPEIPVHLTAQSNVGIFNKLFELGGKSDRIGFHSYIDSLDAIISARDMALAVGNYAGEIGKPPVITEWNWRFLTRMPFEERAKIYPEIIGKALETRSIPEFQQFQFIESLAVNPRRLRGIRHYEPIFLSRRPKPEAFELMKLIDRYGNPSDSLHKLEVSHEVAELDQSGRGQVWVRIRNRTDQPLLIARTVESFGGLKARLGPMAGDEGGDGAGVKDSDEGQRHFVPAGGELFTVVDLETTAPLPGFYHFFVRLENPHGLLRYGWGEARLAGRPKLDLDRQTTVLYPRGVREELDFDLSRPTTVVYGQDAPGLDVEMAVLVSQTLESATGRPVGMYELGHLPENVKREQNLILVGTGQSNALIGESGDWPTTGGARVVRIVHPETGHDWLLLTGATTEDAELAAVDFVLRYWRDAKDSATRRVGLLVDKQLPRGSDPTKLP